MLSDQTLSAPTVGSDAGFGVRQVELFFGNGETAPHGRSAVGGYKVETFAATDAWGEFDEQARTIRLHEELSKRDAFVVLFHEAAHAIWNFERLAKKEDEERVCEIIAEGLARMVLGSPLEGLLAAAKAESWEIPEHKFSHPSHALALDCEGIERAVAANKCARHAPMDYRPWDMGAHKPYNRHLVRGAVAAVRSARERLRQAMEREPVNLWSVHFEMVEVATYSLRVRFYWRNGERADFTPPNK